MPVKAKAVPVVEEVRHVIRLLGPMTDGANGITGFNDFELYLKDAYFSDGWDILHTEVLGNDSGKPKGLNFDPVNMLYVLIKRVVD